MTIIVIAFAGWRLIEFKTSIGAFEFNRYAGTKLKPQSKLILLAHPKQILKLRQNFKWNTYLL
jgi:hypothetical protein